MRKGGIQDAEPVEPPQSSRKSGTWFAKRPSEMPVEHVERAPVRQKINNVGLYKATLYSNIGSFFFGIAVGWSGTAERSVMEQHSYSFQPTELQWSGVCILLTLGAALWCLPMGLMVRLLGCRRTILIQLLPNFLGWFLTVFARSVPMVFVLPIQTPSTGSHWGPDMSASNKQTRTNNWISFDFNAKGDLESSPIKINDTRIPSSRNVGLYIKYLIFCFFFLPWWLVRNFNFVENWIALSRGFHTPTILGECLKWKRL